MSFLLTIKTGVIERTDHDSNACQIALHPWARWPGRLATEDWLG